jgi:hypothetical protein
VREIRHTLLAAARRRDIDVVVALFASYFDIIFAFNRQLHPGEKRLLESAVANCTNVPDRMETDGTAVSEGSCH